jgi:DNA repair exonuclease SbcCD ATPase subunit
MNDNFPYSNEQIAEGFGVTQEAIRTHKSRHKTELSRNVDYVTDSHTNYKVFWSKSGVIKLADWIGTKEAKLFISQWIEKTLEKPFKEISTDTQITPVQPTNQIDFLQGLLDLLKNQDQRLSQIEQRIEKVESKPNTFYLDVNNLEKYKEYRKEKLMEDYRRPMNDLVHTKFEKNSPDARWEVAKKMYKIDTGWDFPHVKNASEEQLRHFLGWIKEK